MQRTDRDHHDAGDIIAVKPYPWSWGAMERKNYAIVVVDGLTKAEALELCQPLYKDDTPMIDHDEDEKTPMVENEIIKDHKYKLDFSAVKTLAPTVKEADFSKFGGGIYTKNEETKVSTLVGEKQPLKAVKINFKTTAGIYDKVLEKKITIGSAVISADRVEK